MMNSLRVLLSELGLDQRKQDLEPLGIKLATIVRRPRPFSYKQLHSVARGTQDPGRLLKLAIDAMLSEVDGSQPLLSASESTTITHAPGMISPGTYVMGKEITCLECLVHFVPDHPSRKKCPSCSPPRKRRKR